LPFAAGHEILGAARRIDSAVESVDLHELVAVAFDDVHGGIVVDGAAFRID
jgi:hypothetical protein